MKILRWIAILLAALVFSCGALIVFDTPTPLPEDSLSAQRLRPGPHPVAKKTLTLRDASREIPAEEGGHPGADARELVCNLWWPEGADGMHPLVVYSHGFMSERNEGVHLNELLASHGYVVIAPEFPKTTFSAPGGPDVRDVVNQPADVSFLIDSVMAWSEDDKPFSGSIDPDRIGTAGLSLGGMTTALVTYHPRLRDPRIKVAVSIAGPTAPFLPSFFRNADVPFLMIGGTIDAMIDYEANAAPVPAMVRHGGLVSIEGASHTGFTARAEPFMRILSNPDDLGCSAIKGNLDVSDDEPHDFGIGSPEEGIAPPDAMVIPCQNMPLPPALHAARQHWITALAATAFFESYFAEDAAERERSREFLHEGIAADFEEVSWEAARG